MRIEELKLRNFRNYEELILHPHPDVNLFYGRNGSGKTNLLEAIHYAALGRSHRVSNDAGIIRNGENFASSTVTIANHLGLREVSLHFHRDQNQKKEIMIDRKKIQKFSELMGCLRCVIFSPEDLDLIKEGPSLRRRYMDMMISQINRKYFVALQHYRNGMEQRNAVLKNFRMNPASDASMLSVFEEAMAGSAAEIIRERRRIIAILSDLARNTYFRVSDTDEQFSVQYQSSVKDEDEIENALCRMYYDHREEDIRSGLTSVGPHRDDLILMLNGRPMKIFASQGQIRTGALSLKLSQMSILRDLSGEEPVLLLDDVMSELDRNRRTRLIEEIRSFQTFITCTDKEDLESDRVSRCWCVSAIQEKGILKEENEIVSRETM